MSTSKIYMDDEGNYRDKTPEMLATETEQAPEPVTDGELTGVQSPEMKDGGSEQPTEDDSVAALPPEPTDPPAGTSKTKR